MARGVGRRAELPPDLAPKAVPLLTQILRCRARRSRRAGCIGWLQAGCPGPTVTVPRMTVPRVSLKSTPSTGFPSRTTTSSRDGAAQSLSST